MSRAVTQNYLQAQFCESHLTVYGLPLVCKQAVLADMARLHTYIRPLKLAYVDAGP